MPDPLETLAWAVIGLFAVVVIVLGTCFWIACHGTADRGETP